jgi:DNA-binding helix-hairpin-helix protein with protein kinase domain
MPPKQKLKDIKYHESAAENLLSKNAMDKQYELSKYVLRKYGIEMTEDPEVFVENYVDREDPMHQFPYDATYEKYKSQVDTLLDYEHNARRRVYNKVKKEKQNLAANIIKRNVKKFVEKKKAIRTLEKHLKGSEGINALYNPKKGLAKAILKRKFEDPKIEKKESKKEKK